MSTIKAKYFSRLELLEITLQGKTNLSALQTWQDAIQTAISLIPSDTKIKALVNIKGYEPETPEVHKQFRIIAPKLLINLQRPPGYLELFPEIKKPEPVSIRGITCTHVAHCHHDETKINSYQTKFGTQHEFFTTDVKAAQKWLLLKIRQT